MVSPAKRLLDVHDFEANRPEDIELDTASVGWRGFRVVHRPAQAPADLLVTPAAAAVPDSPEAGYLLTLNSGLGGATAVALDGRWTDLAGSAQNWILHPAQAEGRYVWSTPADGVHLLLSQPLVDAVAGTLGMPEGRSMLLPPTASTRIPGFVAMLPTLLSLAAPAGRDEPLAAERLVHALAVQLLDSTTDLTVGRRRRVERLNLLTLRQVDRYIDDHMAERIDLAALAKVARMSPYHFARAFKHSSGLSPHGYVTERRLQRALVLLRSGPMGVTETALACGFASSSHFAARFGRRFGFNPSALQACR